MRAISPFALLQSKRNSQHTASVGNYSSGVFSAAFGFSLEGLGVRDGS